LLRGMDWMVMVVLRSWMAVSSSFGLTPPLSPSLQHARRVAPLELHVR
jgi:hypothetical protein